VIVLFIIIPPASRVTAGSQKKTTLLLYQLQGIRNKNQADKETSEIIIKTITNIYIINNMTINV